MNVGFDPVGCTNSIGVLCGEARGRSPGRGSVVVSVVGGFLCSCRLCTSWLEHDDVAGTKRGPNTIFRFTLDGLRICHFGDFGQAELRAEQQRAIGDLDVLFLPVGGGPTVGGESAAAIVRTLRPRLVVPMHYRTSAVNFLEPQTPSSTPALIASTGAHSKPSNSSAPPTNRPSHCSRLPRRAERSAAGASKLSRVNALMTALHLRG